MKKQSFILWLSFNILLPLTPVFVKFLILLFGDNEKIIVTVLESTELLYYSFVICVITIYEIACKKQKSIIECWMVPGASLIILLDIVLLMLIYGKLEAPNIIRVTSIIIWILVPVIAIIHKLREKGE